MHTYTQIFFHNFAELSFQLSVIAVQGYTSFQNSEIHANWMISFCSMCQFLEIINRPFHVGLCFHQFSYGIFPDVSVSGCYYKKAQYKLSQASWPVKEAGGAEECALPQITWSCVI